MKYNNAVGKRNIIPNRAEKWGVFSDKSHFLMIILSNLLRIPIAESIQIRIGYLYYN